MDKGDDGDGGGGSGPAAVREWLLRGEVADRLRSGALVANLFCGHGEALVGLALAFPRSTFVGFDLCPEAVRAGRAQAAQSGVEERASFERASPDDFPGRGYDLVFSSGAAHQCDGPDAKHIRSALRPGGSWLIVTSAGDGADLQESVHAAGFRRFRLAATGVDGWVWEATA